MTQPKTPTDDVVLAAIERAPLDDQPMSDEERRAIAEVKKRGRFVTTAALRIGLGAR